MTGWDPHWQRLVDEKFGEPMPLVGALPDPMVSACAHVLVAYPFARIAGLRHWRESATLAVPADASYLELNVWEISTWCRLIQRSHGRAVCASGEVALHDALGFMPSLRMIARASVDADAVRWAVYFGCDVWPTSHDATNGDTWEKSHRFAALDAWVIDVRSRVSAV